MLWPEADQDRSRSRIRCGMIAPCRPLQSDLDRLSITPSSCSKPGGTAAPPGYWDAAGSERRRGTSPAIGNTIAAGRERCRTSLCSVVTWPEAGLENRFAASALTRTAERPQPPRGLLRRHLPSAITAPSSRHSPTSAALLAALCDVCVALVRILCPMAIRALAQLSGTGRAARLHTERRTHAVRRKWPRRASNRIVSGLGFWSPNVDVGLVQCTPSTVRCTCDAPVPALGARCSTHAGARRSARRSRPLLSRCASSTGACRSR